MSEKQKPKKEVPDIDKQKLGLLDVQELIAVKLRKSGILDVVEKLSGINLEENPLLRPVVSRRYIRPEDTEDGHAREEFSVSLVGSVLSEDGLEQKFTSIPVSWQRLGDAPGQTPEIADGFTRAQVDQLDNMVAILLDHKAGNRDPWLPNLDSVGLATINDPSKRIMALPGVKTA